VLNLLIVSSTDVYSKTIEAFDRKEWRIVMPSLYSQLWTSVNGEVPISTIKEHLTKFDNVYIEEGLRLESIALLQHAIESLGLEEYYLCDFESIDDLDASIENAIHISKSIASRKKAEHAINEIFMSKVTKAIKAYAIEKRSAQYKENNKNFSYEELNALVRAWHKQIQNFYVILPTLAGLKWIAMAERNIMAHDPKTIHRIYIHYKKDGCEFSIPYASIYTDEYIQERNDTIDFFRNSNNKHKVSFYQSEAVNVKPIYKPIILSFLQSKMFYLYHFSIEYTTKLAKRLYHAGLITDPATSSYFIPSGMAISIIQMLNEKYGDEYVLQSQREYKGASSNQSAILPTRFEKEFFPENVEKTVEFNQIRFDNVKMRKDALTMYALIYAVTEWTQLKDAIYDASVLQIMVGGTKPLEIKANSMIDVYDPILMKHVKQTCWKDKHQSLLKALRATGEESEEIHVQIPKCDYDELLLPAGVDYSTTTPKRPPRYGVGRFNTQILGGKGIGTAESFHIIQNNLIYGGIVTLAGSMMHPNDIAMETVEWCEKYASFLLDESSTIEYWSRLDDISSGEEDAQQFVNEYEFTVNEILEASGYKDETSKGVSDAQVRLAKSIAIKKNIKIDDPESFFADPARVRHILNVYSAEEIKEEDKLFKCPICRQGYVFRKEHANQDSGEISEFYSCEHRGCFSIFNKRIQDFFLEKGKDLDKDEVLEALKNISSKQHLKNKGYLFADFKSKKAGGKNYDAKVILDSYQDKNNQTRYGLKLIF